MFWKLHCYFNYDYTLFIWSKIDLIQQQSINSLLSRFRQKMFIGLCPSWEKKRSVFFNWPRSTIANWTTFSWRINFIFLDNIDLNRLSISIWNGYATNPSSSWLWRFQLIGLVPIKMYLIIEMCLYIRKVKKLLLKEKFLK